MLVRFAMLRPRQQAAKDTRTLQRACQPRQRVELVRTPQIPAP
jgi:hypothetical protein